MDDEHTAGFREPCAQCSAVDWGISDEGRFYCRSCHNVIERTREVVDPNFTQGSTRVSTISKGPRSKRLGSGHQWMICEGFQFILSNQANALLRLGVSPHFKDQVLCQMWRLYLQKSRQAFTNDPVRSCRFTMRCPGSDTDSAADSSVVSASETDGEAKPSSNAGSCSDWSEGSVDIDVYLSAQRRRSGSRMNMRMLLALIYLALTWSREPLTLSDLLRLVSEGHVPYLNAYEDLPDEMRLSGRDALIFRVESIPSYQAVHKEAQALALLLQLQEFPPVGRQCLLHPALLSLRYLTDANLPDELHPWICRLMERAGMADQTLHTFSPVSHPVLPHYDVQAAALIIVTMKVIFGLDDHTEWALSSKTNLHDDQADMFSLRRWYRLTQAALTAARQRTDADMARKQWKSKKLLYPNRKKKSVMMKRKRMAEQVQICMEKLSSRPGGVQRRVASSFRFRWGEEDGADGPSLHHKKLDRVLTLEQGVLLPSNTTYWHPALRACKPQNCGSHYLDVEDTLPRSFVWTLQFFSFLLDVSAATLYDEVLRVERRVLAGKTWTRLI